MVKYKYSSVELWTLFEHAVKTLCSFLGFFFLGVLEKSLQLSDDRLDPIIISQTSLYYTDHFSFRYLSSKWSLAYIMSFIPKPK